MRIPANVIGEARDCKHSGMTAGRRRPGLALPARAVNVLLCSALTGLFLAGGPLTGLADEQAAGKPKITGVELLKAEKKKPETSATPEPPTQVPPVTPPARPTRKKSKRQIVAEQRAAQQAAAVQAALEAAQLQAAQIKAAADKKATFYLLIAGEKLDGAQKRDVHIFNPLNNEFVNGVESVEPAGPGQIAVKITLDAPAEISKIVVRGAETEDFRLTIAGKKVEAPAIQNIETTFEAFKSPNFPNQYTVFVTKKAGDGAFESDPNRMRVEMLPPGASDVRIRPGSNPDQLVVDFMAPEKFEVKNIIVTVYDSGNLDGRKVKAIAKPFKEKTDPNQPVIGDAELIYIQRNKGFGRLKLEGSGFGDYERLPMTTEDILRNNFPRYAQALNSSNATIRNPETFTVANNPYPNWRDQINQRVRIELVPRNPNLRIEKVEILYIDDKLIDVYFEFLTTTGYSKPFRLARASITVKKNGTNTAQTIKDGDVTVTLTKAGTFFATHDIGPKRDQTLHYQYALLDHAQANNLFGRGVADTFYVIQLSVTNIGTKKVAVPLAAIQAEVEWAAGSPDTNPRLTFLQGPETIAPIPLESVSGFFDAYLKRSGRRAQVFNFLQGVATLGAAVIPFVGPSFKDGVTVLASAGIPALKTISGDLSGQQLQNLTALSWQTTEVLAPGGGSLNKYIYIPRKAEQGVPVTEFGYEIKKLITNIVGLEVVGFEVTESEAKQATPTP
jgi:hypothetical protein